MASSVGQYIDILIYTVIFIDLVTDTVVLFCYRYVTGFEKRDLIAQIMILRYRRF